ncbi:MAG: hypothetical protein K9J25_04210 [Bacteroidales bacterium]|nr:hypothetical protein [Bacteroidales bacterium]
MPQDLHIKDIEASQQTGTESAKQSKAADKAPVYNSLYNALYKFGSCDVYDYLDVRNLSHIKNSIVLSPAKHFFFEEEDLHNVEMVIDIHNLSGRKNTRSYFERIYNSMPEGSYFTGSFKTPGAKNSGSPDYHRYLFDYEDATSKDENGSGMLLGMIDKLISRVNSSLTGNINGKEAEKILQMTGFEVMDITEMNGKVYFTSVKTSAYRNNYSLS